MPKQQEIALTFDHPEINFVPSSLTGSLDKIRKIIHGNFSKETKNSTMT